MKKYITITVILMLMCLMLSGCKKEEEKPESLYDLPVAYEIVAEIKEDSLSSTGFELILTNEGTECRFEFGYIGGCMVEKYENGQWSEVEPKSLQGAGYAILFRLEPGESLEFKDGWSQRYGELPPGKYRYIKPVEKWQPKQLTQDVCFFVEFTL